MMKWNRLTNAFVWRALNTRTWFRHVQPAIGLILLCLPMLSFGRGVDSTTLYTPRSECINYNTFLQGDSLEALMYYSEKIYPTGLIKFHPTRTHELDGFDDLKPYLDICSNCTFQLTSTKTGHFDQERTYTRYQQYYLGVEVENGGVIMVEDDDNPCGITYLSAFIVSDINVNITPQINLATLASIVQGLITGPVIINPAKLRHQLVISHNLNNQCGYSLTWKVEYDDHGRHKAWIDAISGSVLKTIKVDSELNAPTEVYGDPLTNIVFLSDFTDNTGLTSLMTSDGSLITYDFGGLDDLPDTQTEFHANSIIPEASNITSWTTEADASVFQAHFSGQTVLQAFSTHTPFDFGKVHIGANIQEANARAYMSFSDMDEAFISFGTGQAGLSYAVHDAVGHELGHIILKSVFSFEYDDIDNKTLHEGVADMIGTFIESKIQGGIDWSIADDAMVVVRDLSNPQYNCFSSVKNLTNQHNRSTPMG
ncbi:MAG: hypothetical protein MI974_29300 [Chitinophagales bacterium]|nr:hypothetical protein [Chitinophagales bacterium]